MEPDLLHRQRGSEADPEPVRFVLFMDAGLPDLALLSAGLPRTGRGFLVPRHVDAATFMAGRIAALPCPPAGLEEIGVVAHGGPGRVLLGREPLCTASLASSLPALRTLGGFLRPSGRLRLLACEAAAGPDGQAFGSALARSLDRRVLAATQRLGNGAAVLDVVFDPDGTSTRL